MYSGSRLRETRLVDRGSAPVRGGDVGAEHANLGVERLAPAGLEGAEARRLDGALRGGRERGRQRDDADRALGVDREVRRRLALVGDDGVGAVLREGHHVGKSADGDLAELRARGIRLVGVEEDEVTGVGLRGRFEGDDAEAVVADRDRVGDTVRGDVEQLDRLLGVAVVEHRHGTGLRVDDEEAVAVGLDDLGRGFLVDAGVVGADRSDRQGGTRGAVRDGLGTIAAEAAVALDRASAHTAAVVAVNAAARRRKVEGMAVSSGSGGERPARAARSCGFCLQFVTTR